MSVLRELIDEASSSISSYKRPNVDEAQQALNDVMMAAGLPGIMHDSLDDIDEEGGMLHISTSWSSRGCACGETYRLPSFIIDAEDPIAAAKAWGKEQAINKAQGMVDKAKADLAWAEKKLAEAKA